SRDTPPRHTQQVARTLAQLVEGAVVGYEAVELPLVKRSFRLVRVHRMQARTLDTHQHTPLAPDVRGRVGEPHVADHHGTPPPLRRMYSASLGNRTSVTTTGRPPPSAASMVRAAACNQKPVSSSRMATPSRCSVRRTSGTSFARSHPRLPTTWVSRSGIRPTS